MYVLGVTYDMSPPPIPCPDLLGRVRWMLPLVSPPMRASRQVGEVELVTTVFKEFAYK